MTITSLQANISPSNSNYQINQTKNNSQITSSKFSVDSEFIQKYASIAEVIRQNPELCGHEQKTNQIITAELEKFIPKYNIHTFGANHENNENDKHDVDNKSKYGIIAKIDGNKNSSGKAIIITADMDALPNNTDKSINGAAHNCGHNVNMAGLIAVAEKLVNQQVNFNGSVFLIFTPAEESGGGFGEMIDKGLFEDAKFGLNQYSKDDLKAFTMHNNPKFATGEIATRSGAFLCGNQDYKINLSTKNQDNNQNSNYPKTLNIKVTGKGGHAGMPHEAKTPIIPMYDIINTLKNFDEYRDIKVSSINADAGARNSIPDSANLSLDVPNHIDLDKLQQFIQNAISDYSISFGVSVKNPNIVNATTAILSNVFNLVSQKTPANSSNILTPSYVNAQNDKAEIYITTRFFESHLGAKLGDNISSIVQTKASTYDVDFSIDKIKDAYPPTINTPELTSKVAQYLTDLSQEIPHSINKINTNAAQIGGRDGFPFAKHNDKVSEALYMFIGTGGDDIEQERGLHHPELIGKAGIYLERAVPAYLKIISEELKD
jgi:metal-dependent amidase/aminoacylase/carboxypeptidase family protein